MEETKSIDKLAEYFIDKGTEIRGNSLYLHGSRVSNLVKFVEKNEELLLKLDLFTTFKLSTFNSTTFNVELKEVLYKKLKQKNKDEISKYLDEDVTVINLDDYIVYKDIEEDSEVNDKDKIIVRRDSNQIVNDTISPLAFRHAVGKKIYDHLKEQLPLARKVYDPFRINNYDNDKRWIEFNDKIQCNLVNINLCSHPDWRYNRDLDAKLTKEEIYFIESSFESQKDLQYYIDSAYESIVNKMWVYTMLLGIKGTGKTTLIEMLIPCIGKNNYRKAPQNALKSNFNSYKLNKRLVLFDEMVANTNEIVNVLKSDANKEFNVEEKGVDAFSAKNFVSAWIATNNISDWKFTHDERRFSVIELTKKTTADRNISDDWMSQFSERIETDDWANAFFNYLEANKSKVIHPHIPYKSKAFWNVVYESLKPWQMTLADAVLNGELSGEYVQLSNIYGDNEKYLPKTHKSIIDFLENYRHEGKIKLGTYVKGRSVLNSEIKINTDLLPKQTDTNLEK